MIDKGGQLWMIDKCQRLPNSRSHKQLAMKDNNEEVMSLTFIFGGGVGKLRYFPYLVLYYNSLVPLHMFSSPAICFHLFILLFCHCWKSHRMNVLPHAP